MTNPLICKYELCSDPAQSAGFCYAHYGQLHRGETLRPKKGSPEYYASKLNENGEKQCSRCGYWLLANEFYVRYDSKTPLGRAHCNRCNILRRMGLTARDYDAILASQGGRCAICGTDQESAGGRTLCVDHDHSCCPGTGSCGRCIRGIVCNACNALLGFARDNRDILGAASEFLRKAPVRRAILDREIEIEEGLASGKYVLEGACPIK